MPSEEEVQEIIHQLRVHPQEIDEMNTGNTDDFITSNDQVKMKRPVQHQEKQTLSPEMKRKLDAIIDNYSDIFSKNQYNISQSTHPTVEIPTEGPPCISSYTIPINSDPGQITPSTSVRSQHDTVYNEYMGITHDYCTQKGIRDTQGPQNTPTSGS